MTVLMDIACYIYRPHREPHPVLGHLQPNSISVISDDAMLHLCANGTVTEMMYPD